MSPGLKIKELHFWYIMFPLLLWSAQVPAQHFADKSWFLVDSLDTAGMKLSDRKILEKSLQMYHESETDTGRINSLNLICEGMMDQAWVKYQLLQMELIDQAMKRTRSNDERNYLRLMRSGALNNLGYIEQAAGNADSALWYFHQSIEIDIEIDNKKGLAASYSNAGQVYQNKGDLPGALDYYQKSLSLREELGDRKGIANCLNNLGAIHQNQGNLELALSYYDKSLNLRLAEGDKRGIGESYNNLGVIFHRKMEDAENVGDFYLMDSLAKRSREWYEKALNLSEEIGDRRSEALALHNLGGVSRILSESYRKRGMFEQAARHHEIAFEYCKRSLDIRLEIGDPKGQSASYNSLGHLEFSAGRLDQADEYGMKGLAIAQQVGMPELIKRNAGLLSIIAARQQDYKKAFEMRNLEIQMHDSITGLENLRAAAEQEARYQYEKASALESKEHEKQMLLAGEKAQRQKVVIISVVGMALLLTGFLLFVFNRLKLTRTQRNQIRDQKREIEKTHAVLSSHHKEIKDSILYAKRIQQAILPSMTSMQHALRDGFVLYQPKDVVAGDFYWLEYVFSGWVEETSEAMYSGSGQSAPDQVALRPGSGNQPKRKLVYFAAADCTGHGVPGAMVSVVCSNALSKALHEENAGSTGDLLDKTRNLVVKRLGRSGEEVKDGMDISLAAIDFNSLELQWSGANNPLWLVRNGELKEFRPDKQPVGAHSEITPFTTHYFTLEKGDTLYLLTDGFQDQFGGEKGKKFKSSALKQLILSMQDKGMDEQKLLLQQAFTKWKMDQDQVDDVCILGVRI